MKSISKTFHFKRILWILFLLYCFSLILLSILPINGESSLFNDTYIVKIRADYFLHTLTFLPFLPLATYTLSLTFQREKLIPRIFVIIIIGVLFAIITEVIQFYLPYRVFNFNDLIANIFGILLSLPILLIKRKTRTQNLSTKES